MNDETPEIKSEEALPSPLSCWSGTAVASGMSFAAYLITRNVVAHFASKPPTGNTLALQIGATVRTLVMGIFTMATGVFGLIAVGLFLLGLKSLLTSDEASSTEKSS